MTELFMGSILITSRAGVSVRTRDCSRLFVTVCDLFFS